MWTLDPQEVLAEDYRHTMIPACNPLRDPVTSAVIGVELATRASGRDILVEAVPDEVNSVWHVQCWTVAATDDEQLRALAFETVKASGAGYFCDLDESSASVPHPENRAHPAAYAVLAALASTAAGAAKADSPRV